MAELFSRMLADVIVGAFIAGMAVVIGLAALALGGFYLWQHLHWTP